MRERRSQFDEYGSVLESLSLAIDIVEIAQSRSDPSIALEFLQKHGFESDDLAGALESYDGDRQTAALEGVLQKIGEVFKHLTGKYQEDFRRIRNSVDTAISRTNTEYLVIDPADVKKTTDTIRKKELPSISDQDIALVKNLNWFDEVAGSHDEYSLFNAKEVSTVLTEVGKLSEYIKKLCSIAPPSEFQSTTAYKEALEKIGWYGLSGRFLIFYPLEPKSYTLAACGFNTVKNFSTVLSQIDAGIVDTRPAITLLHDHVVRLLSGLNQNAKTADELKSNIELCGRIHLFIKRGIEFISDVVYCFDEQNGLPGMVSGMIGHIVDYPPVD